VAGEAAQPGPVPLQSKCAGRAEPLTLPPYSALLQQLQDPSHHAGHCSSLRAHDSSAAARLYHSCTGYSGVVVPFVSTRRSNERRAQLSPHHHHHCALTPTRDGRHDTPGASTRHGPDRIQNPQPLRWRPTRRPPLPARLARPRRSTSASSATAHSAGASTAAVTNVLVSAPRSSAMELDVLGRGSCLLMRDTAQ
jgi:hypothetical protein